MRKKVMLKASTSIEGHMKTTKKKIRKVWNDMEQRTGIERKKAEETTALKSKPKKKTE